MAFSRIPLHLFLYCFISLDLQLVLADFECQNLLTLVQHRAQNWMHIELACCLDFVMFFYKIVFEKVSFQQTKICQKQCVYICVTLRENNLTFRSW